MTGLAPEIPEDLYMLIKKVSIILAVPSPVVAVSYQEIKADTDTC